MAQGFNNLEAILGGKPNIGGVVSQLQSEDLSGEAFLLNTILFPRSPSLVSSAFILRGDNQPKFEGVVDIVRPDEAQQFIVEGDKNTKSKNGANKSIMAMNIITPKASYSSVNSNRVSMFVNSLPPIIANSLIPYVEVEFEFPTTDGLKPFGLNRFLLGDAEPTGFDRSYQRAKVSSVKDSQTGTYMSYSGMELFTTPATLSVRREDEGLIKPVLRPNASIASINTLEIQVASSGQGQGFNLAKKATLSMTLFDRSRLRDFGELFQIKQYGGATVWITYGWRCKQVGNDPFADFINNSMLTREAYTVTQPGYSFDNNLVKISLVLGSKTYNELNTMTLADVYAGSAVTGLYGANSSYKDMTTNGRQTWGELIKLIYDTGKKIESSINVDVLSSGLIPSPDSTAPLPSEVDTEINQRINKLIESVNKKRQEDIKAAQRTGVPNTQQSNAIGKDIDRLKKLLLDYWSFSQQAKGRPARYLQYTQNESRSNDGAKKLLDDIASVSYDRFNAKWASSAKKWAPESPYPALPTSPVASRATGKPTPGPKPTVQPEYISLGTVLLKTLGTAAVVQDRIKDVQFVFYKMNEKSAKARDLLVSEFPINVSILKKDYAKAVTRKGGVPLAMGEFLALVTSQVHDVRSKVYGLSEYYKPWSQGEPPTRTDAWKDTIAPDEKSFQPPYIGIDVQVGESDDAPANNSGAPRDLLETLSTSAKIRRESMGNNALVMRIHVYDSNYVGVPNIKLNQLPPSDGSTSSQVSPDAARNEAIDILTQRAGTNPDGSKRIELTPLKGTGDVKFNFKDATAFDDLLSSYMPTIRIGSNGSTIITVGAGSKMNQLIQTAALVGTSPGQAELGAPAITTTTGLPYVITPAEVNLTIMGCPLVRYGQTFYVDFGTSTTLDGDYYVGTMTHSFAPGKFTTTMKLAARSGAAAFMSERNMIASLDLLKQYLGLSPT